MSISETEKKKRAFRNSKKWKSFRHQMVIKNKSRDFVTGKKLVKGFELHHCDLRSENYQILDEENFICLNKNTHKCIHWLYLYWLKDPEIIDRLVSVLEKMKEINK